MLEEIFNEESFKTNIDITTEYPFKGGKFNPVNLLIDLIAGVTVWYILFKDSHKQK